MRAAIFLLPLLPLGVAACLSKPDRPTGADGPGIDGRPMDGAPPTFIVRRDIEVGDINTDGHDDLLRWGNVVEGAQPRIWIYYGSASGLSPAPNVTVDPMFDGTAAWFEVLDVSVDEVDPNMAGFEVMVLVAEDRVVPDGTTPQQRGLHVDVWSPVANGTTDPLVRSGVVMNEQIGGLATAPTPAFVTRRHTTALVPELVFGGLAATFRVPDLTLPTPVPEPVRCLDEGGAMLPTIQDLFPSPGGTGDNLMAIDHGIAWMSDGDAFGTPPATYSGTDVPLSDSGRRAVRRRRPPADGSTLPLVVAAGGEFSAAVQIVQDEGGVPAVYTLMVNPAEPVDQAIGNVGGTGQIDVVALDDDMLVVYKDIPLPGGGGNVTPSGIVPGPDDFAGYDLLAIGNFSDASSGDEILVLGPNVAPRCYVLTNTLDPC